MEGKAVLFKEFGGVNAVPVCLDTQDTEEIIKAVTAFLRPFPVSRSILRAAVMLFRLLSYE